MKGWTSAYRKLRRRGTIDFPVVGAAASVHVNEEGVCEEARLALGAVASSPVLALKASEILIGKRPDRSLIESTANEAAKLAKPMDNTDMNLSYRKKMVSVFASRALSTPTNPRRRGLTLRTFSTAYAQHRSSISTFWSMPYVVGRGG